MARTGGISGIAVGLALAGGYFMFVGIKDVSFIEGLRQMLRGTTPSGAVKTPTQVPSQLELRDPGPAGSGIGDAIGSGTGAAGSGVVGNSALGRKIAEVAKTGLGVPYKWGGTTPAGWDCSGFVYWTLNKAGVKVSRLISTQYLTWNGATTVPRASCQAGDLCVWPGAPVGHIGIAVDNKNMANAPTFGIPTRIQTIRSGVTIRRVKGA